MILATEKGIFLVEELERKPGWKQTYTYAVTTVEGVLYFKLSARPDTVIRTATKIIEAFRK